MKTSVAFGALLLASLAAMAPAALFGISGDYAFYSVMIDCFAEQFWQGDVHPRWCFTANTGLGAPLFLFYFPLPFYVAALIQPITALGFTTYHVYIAGCYLATLAVGWFSWRWLKEIVPPVYALLAAVLLLFIPYRMEVIFFRAAYAEAWALALLPLLFMYARRVVRGEGGARGYALSFAALWLTHVTLAAIGGLFTGIYVLLMCRSRAPLLRFAAAAMVALALASFYLAPAVHYSQFITGERAIDGGPPAWANGFLSMGNVTGESAQPRPAVMAALTLAALASMALAVSRKRIGDGFLRRETLAFATLLALASLLLFPWSKPFYDLARPVSNIIFPWRMQAVFVPCFGFFAAVLMCQLGAHKTWKADYALLLVLLGLMACFTGASIDKKQLVMLETVRTTRTVVYPEYRSLWADAALWDEEKVRSRMKNPPPRVAIIQGRGEVKVEQWDWRGIALSAQSEEGLTLRLDHFYFPIWKAAAPVTLSPEQGSGLMLLHVPPGGQRITLRY